MRIYKIELLKDNVVVHCQEIETSWTILQGIVKELGRDFPGTIIRVTWRS